MLPKEVIGKTVWSRDQPVKQTFRSAWVRVGIRVDVRIGMMANFSQLVLR